MNTHLLVCPNCGSDQLSSLGHVDDLGIIDEFETFLCQKCSTSFPETELITHEQFERQKGNRHAERQARKRKNRMDCQAVSARLASEQLTAGDQLSAANPTLAGNADNSYTKPASDTPMCQHSPPEKLPRLKCPVCQSDMNVEIKALSAKLKKAIGGHAPTQHWKLLTCWTCWIEVYVNLKTRAYIESSVSLVEVARAIIRVETGVPGEFVDDNAGEPIWQFISHPARED